MNGPSNNFPSQFIATLLESHEWVTRVTRFQTTLGHGTTQSRGSLLHESQTSCSVLQPHEKHCEALFWSKAAKVPSSEIPLHLLLSEGKQQRHWLSVAKERPAQVLFSFIPPQPYGSSWLLEINIYTPLPASIFYLIWYLSDFPQEAQNVWKSYVDNSCILYEFSYCFSIRVFFNFHIIFLTKCASLSSVKHSQANHQRGSEFLITLLSTILCIKALYKGYFKKIEHIIIVLV